MILNIKGRLKRWDTPVVMGILNVTPDSFYPGSRVSIAEIADRAGEMLVAGAGMLDLGGYSTRPGAASVSPQEEIDRLAPALEAISAAFPEAVVSVDTFRASVAREAVRLGAAIINDIGGGTLDGEMFATVAELKVPYILMHMRGTPATMQQLTDYSDVTAEVLEDLAFKTDELRQLGVCDVIIDPGFGFAKTVDQNYELLAGMPALRRIQAPILAGISRKTMIWKELGITPSESLNGTTALNMACLMQGADILRVHDVKEAAETVAIFNALKRNTPEEARQILTSKNVQSIT